MQVFLFLALFIALVAGVFAMQNSESVRISFLAWEFNSSLAVVLLITLVVGALFSTLVSMPSNLKARWAIRQQRKKLADMEAHMAELQAELDAARQVSAESIPLDDKEDEPSAEDSKAIVVAD